MSENRGYISLISNTIAMNRSGGESAHNNQWKHTVTIDQDRLLDQILEVFVEYNTWLTFRQLAFRLTGEQSNEDLIAGVVHRHSRVFIVNDGHWCKLRALEDGDTFELPR